MHAYFVMYLHGIGGDVHDSAWICTPSLASAASSPKAAAAAAPSSLHKYGADVLQGVAYNGAALPALGAARMIAQPDVFIAELAMGWPSAHAV
jgi:hypothetical protein